MAVRSFILPEEATKLNEDAAQRYFETLLDTCAFLRREVIEKIEKAVKERSDYDDNSPPDEVAKENFNLGGLELTLVTVPTEKKPSYAEIYKKIFDYVNFLREDFKEGNLHQNLVSIDKKPYVSLDMLIKRIKGMRKVLEGVRQEFHYEVPEILQKLIVPMADYEKLPQESEIYGKARAFFDEAIIRGKKTFENLLGQSAQIPSPKKKGKEAEENKTIENWRSIGDYIFKTIVEKPSMGTSYAGIYNALVLEHKKPEKCGELMLLQQGMQDKMPSMIMSPYDLRKRNDAKFVSLNGFGRRLHRIYLENSSIKEDKRVVVHGFPAI